MNALLKLSRRIDALTERVGQAALWLVLVVVLVSALNAVMRYTIDYSSNAFLEIQWYLFGLIFLSCGGYTFLRNEHVRIDLVSGHFSKRGHQVCTALKIQFSGDFIEQQDRPFASARLHPIQFRQFERKQGGADLPA